MGSNANGLTPTGTGRHSVRGHRLPSLFRLTILHENSVLQISSGVWGQTAPNGGVSRHLPKPVLFLCPRDESRAGVLGRVSFGGF